MKTLDDILATAHTARLIPVVADSRKEERVVSIFLAALTRVRPFAKAILDRLDSKVGKRSILAAYTEVEFPSSDTNTKDRPDGLLSLTTRKTRWTALVEAKIAGAEIDADQIQRYGELARRFQIDAVVTLSNQLVALPTLVPYSVPKKLGNQVRFFHMSWISVLTSAHLILQDRDNVEPDQAFILNEMARYFEHDSSGVTQFRQMNPEWRTLVDGVRNRHQFGPNSPEIENTVASWHQKERDISLLLSRRIGHEVVIRGLSRKYQLQPDDRLRDASNVLASSKELRSTFAIPNAAADLEVMADLQRRTISCSMKLNAPLDTKRASARINWLRRQLRNIDREDVAVRALWPRRILPTQASLADVKADSKSLENDSQKSPPTGFEVIMIKDIARRFSGRSTFIEDLEKMVPEFYDNVGCHLRTWTPPPPPIAKDDPIHESDHPQQTPAPPPGPDLADPVETS